MLRTAIDTSSTLGVKNLKCNTTSVADSAANLNTASPIAELTVWSLKFCLADASHNFKWVIIIQVCQIRGHVFLQYQL